MARRYAEGTEVSSGKSQEEIRRLIQNYGGTRYMTMDDNITGEAQVAFEMGGRTIRFKLKLPSVGDFPLNYQSGSRHYTRTQEQAVNLRDQACRERWRALAVCIKAKLISIESGIEEFDDAFLAQIVTPDGSTVGEKLRPQLTGAVPTRLALNA